MFDNNISLQSILTSMESALSLEMSGELKTADLVNNAVERLENQYACTLDRDVYSIQSENQLMADNINLLLRDVKQCLAEMSLYISLKMFHMNMPISLADVNYLGHDKEQMLTELQYLMYEREYKKYAEEIIPTLYVALDNIGMSSVKRLFITMLMLYRLGISEGVSVLAQVLYLSGLIV